MAIKLNSVKSGSILGAPFIAYTQSANANNNTKLRNNNSIALNTMLRCFTRYNATHAAV